MNLYDLYVGPRMELDNLLVGAAFGCALGMMQWLVLRRWVYRAGWWVLGNIVSWTVSFFLEDVIVIAVKGTGLVVACEIVGGTVAAIITGLTLVWLLRNPIDQAGAIDQS